MIDTIIFDMDGVIIETENFWKTAEKEVFQSLGVVVDSENTRITAHMTTKEVTQFWYERFPWKSISLREAEQQVIDQVDHAIHKSGTINTEWIQLVSKLCDLGFKVGIASNSPLQLIQRVVSIVRLHDESIVLTSAQEVNQGKPSPEIYLLAARRLNSSVENCIAVEDTSSGLLAASRANITTAYYNPCLKKNNVNTNHCISSLNDLLEIVS